MDRIKTSSVVEALKTVKDEGGYRINDALPKPLRKGRYDANDPAQAEAVKSLSSVEHVQRFNRVVLDEQLRRLEGRWSADTVQLPDILVQTQAPPSDTASAKPKKRKPKSLRDKQRVIRDKEIAEIADVSKTPLEFLHLLDDRKVPPQPTWIGEWPGSWVKAYQNNPHLRALIHKDKSRALARVQTGRIR